MKEYHQDTNQKAQMEYWIKRPYPSYEDSLTDKDGHYDMDGASLAPQGVILSGDGPVVTGPAGSFLLYLELN